MRRGKWLLIVVLALVSQFLCAHANELKPLAGIDRLKKIDQVICSVSPIGQLAFSEAKNGETGKFNALFKTGSAGAPSVCWTAQQYQPAARLEQAGSFTTNKLWLLNRALLL